MRRASCGRRLLASLLSLERLFRDDFLDGSLEQLLLLPTPLPMTVLGKVCAHWVVTGLPLLILSPLVALLLSLDMQTGWRWRGRCCSARRR